MVSKNDRNENAPYAGALQTTSLVDHLPLLVAGLVSLVRLPWFYMPRFNILKETFMLLQALCTKLVVARLF